MWNLVSEIHAIFSCIWYHKPTIAMNASHMGCLGGLDRAHVSFFLCKQGSQFSSLYQVFPLGKRLHSDKPQCVDAWMMNFKLNPVKHFLWPMTIIKTCSVVPPHCHHGRLSYEGPWLSYTVQFSLRYNISFTQSGRRCKYFGSWGSPVCIWSLLPVWQVLITV